MAGIAGCTLAGARANVEAMLNRIAYRGPAGGAISDAPKATLGVVWTGTQGSAEKALTEEHTAVDGEGPDRLAFAAADEDGIRLCRDLIGVAPLYYGQAGRVLYFASEVKALLRFTKDVHAVPPGHTYDGKQARRYLFAKPGPLLEGPPDAMAAELRNKLAASVRQCLPGGEAAAWLSGGLDSSLIAALARLEVSRLHTFTAGLEGADDFAPAREVAAHIGSEHHEIVLTIDDMLAALPEVIYHLESFDALLVCSSVANYFAGREAARYAPVILSGEGGDELFAGYAYLKLLDRSILANELQDLIARLHNTALQRVDRCSAAHGIVAHVPFLAPDVLNYAARIPMEYKLRDGVEKWILRRASEELLPAGVLNRTKSKFWEGAGVGSLLLDVAEARVSDRDFAAERDLPNGWQLSSKEELLYYRIFREQFGDLENLDWMGRSKVVPEA